MRYGRPDGLPLQAVGPLVKGYQRLTVDEVMVDLPSLDSEQLRFVRSLEQVGGRRRRVLDRVGQLLLLIGEPAPPVLGISPGRPSRNRARRVAKLAAVLAAVAVVGAGAGVIVVNRQGSTAPVATGSAGATGTTSTDGAAAAAPAGGTGTDSLERLMAVGLPAGYLQVPDAAADAGPLDLTAAVRLDGTPEARSSLTDAGFVHGFTRTWQNGDRYEIKVSIYQFKDPAGAAAYGQRRIRAARANPGATTTTFGVSGIPGAVGLTATARDSTTSGVSFAKAGYFVQLSVNWYAATGLEDTAQQVARDQYGLL